MEKNDHDLLVGIGRELCDLKKHFTNHLRHHWAAELVLLSGIIALIVKLL